MLTAEDILNAQDTIIKKIKVDEWGGEVCIKEFTAAERQEYSAVFDGDDHPSDFLLAKIISMSVVNEKGEPIFKEDQVEALKHKSAVAMEKIAREVLVLNGLSDGAVEEAQGN